MLFYKFQKPEALPFTMLRRRELFFASVDELNDANECRPHLVLNGSSELWQRLAEFLLERVCFYSERVRIDETDLIKRIIALGRPLGAALKKKARLKDVEFGHLGPMVADASEPLLTPIVGPSQTKQIAQWLHWFVDNHLPDLLTEERYIASFCLSATNPTMWGHYADAERGFALVYTTVDDSITITSPVPIFSGTRPSKQHGDGITEIGYYREEKITLARVKYATKPPKVNAFIRLIPKFHYSEEEDHYDVPLMLPGDARKKQESMIGLLKYSEWRYEREVRAFFPTYEQLRPDVRAVRVAAEHIQGIIFGSKMSQENMVRAVTCAHLMRAELEQPPPQPFMFFRARRSADRFRLSIEPAGILHGYYHGEHNLIRTVKDLSIEEAREIHRVSEVIGSS